MTGFRPLGELSTLITKGTTPNAKLGGFSESGVNYVKSESLSYSGGVDETKFVHISEDTHLKLRRSILRERDILMSIAGANLGKVGMVKKSILPANTNQAVAIIRVNPDEASPEFVQYFLRDSRFVANSLAGVAQSAQPNLNLGDISRFEIPEIPIGEQEKIAALLGALDDKIELNRRMNATLEEMARALYRSWFVDFDPVHARALGQPPAHMDATTAALFPDSFGPDGLPKGWEAGTLMEMAQLNPEKWSKRSHPDEVRYLDLANVKRGALETVSDYQWDEAPSRARMVLRKGDTIVGTVRPGNGSYALIHSRGLTGSTGFAVLRAKNERDVPFLYCAATSSENIERLTNLADGAAYPAVRPEVVGKTSVVLAPDSVCHAFGIMAGPWLKRCGKLAEERDTLAALRDTLLPRLMSGELRIREAEKQVEEVV